MRTLYVHSPEYIRVVRSSIWRPPLLQCHLVGPLLCASHSQCRVRRHHYDIHRNGVRTPVIRITGKEVAPSISIENPSNPSSPFQRITIQRNRNYEWTNHPGISLKMGAGPLALCGNQHRAGLVYNPVRPTKERAWERINFVPILSLPNYAIAYFGVESLF